MQSSAASQAARRTIVSSIVIVDEAEELLPLRKFLKSRGYQIHCAQDAGQARSLVTTRKPDMVITEAMLPQETGFEFCNFLKRNYPALPVILLTDIDLDIARNLAIWTGADAYVTKPYDLPWLEGLIADVADAVWLRLHSQQGDGTGRIEFDCACGKRLAVRQENAGKAVRCPKCEKLVLTPAFSSNATGVWKSASNSTADSADPRQANLFCSVCGQMVHLLQNSRGNVASCGNCGHKHTVPQWLMNQRRFYFQPAATEEAMHLRRRNTIRRFLTIECESCRSRYPLDPAHPERAVECPHCRRVNSNPSLKNSPLARAALASTGRLFAISAGHAKNKKFLLPEDREITLGASERCALRLAELRVAQRHCALRWDHDRVRIRPLSDQAETKVNGSPIFEEIELLPGDLVQLGTVRLLLMGHRDLDASDCDAFTRAMAEDHEEMTIRDARIALQAAKVIQMHWELQRQLLQQHPEWILDETASASPTTTADWQQHVVLSDPEITQVTDTQQLKASDSVVAPESLNPIMQPPVRLPAPEDCRPEELPSQESVSSQSSVRDRRKLREAESSSQASQILSGFFKRKPH